MIALLALLHADDAVPASRPNPDAPPGTCDTLAIVADPDPAGLNVRDQPTTQGSTVVDQVHQDKVVHLRDARDGWVLLDQEEDYELESSREVGGWVSTKLLTVGLAGEAEALGAELKDAPDGQPAGKVMRVERLHGCQGAWLEVGGKDEAGATVRGWLAPELQCPNPLTTCA